MLIVLSWYRTIPIVRMQYTASNCTFFRTARNQTQSTRSYSDPCNSVGFSLCWIFTPRVRCHCPNQASKFDRKYCYCYFHCLWYLETSCFTLRINDTYFNNALIWFYPLWTWKNGSELTFVSKEVWQRRRKHSYITQYMSHHFIVYNICCGGLVLQKESPNLFQGVRYFYLCWAYKISLCQQFCNTVDRRS